MAAHQFLDFPQTREVSIPWCGAFLYALWGKSVLYISKGCCLVSRLRAAREGRHLGPVVSRIVWPLCSGNLRAPSGMGCDQWPLHTRRRCLCYFYMPCMLLSMTMTMNMNMLPRLC